MINQNNVKIAQFMGYKYQKKLLIDESDWGGTYTEYLFLSKTPIKYYDEYIDVEWVKDNEVVQVDFIDYHEDWNLLIEVIEKIESLGFRFEIAFNEVDLYDVKEKRFSTCINITNCEGLIDRSLTKQQAIYHAILEFINWYNEQEIKSN